MVDNDNDKKGNKHKNNKNKHSKNSKNKVASPKMKTKEKVLVTADPKTNTTTLEYEVEVIQYHKIKPNQTDINPEIDNSAIRITSPDGTYQIVQQHPKDIDDMVPATSDGSNGTNPLSISALNERMKILKQEHGMNNVVADQEEDDMDFLSAAMSSYNINGVSNHIRVCAIAMSFFCCLLF